MGNETKEAKLTSTIEQHFDESSVIDSHSQKETVTVDSQNILEKENKTKEAEVTSTIERHYDESSVIYTHSQQETVTLGSQSENINILEKENKTNEAELTSTIEQHYNESSLNNTHFQQETLILDSQSENINILDKKNKTKEAGLTSSIEQHYNESSFACLGKEGKEMISKDNGDIEILHLTGGKVDMKFTTSEAPDKKQKETTEGNAYDEIDDNIDSNFEWDYHLNKEIDDEDGLIITDYEQINCEENK